MKRPHTYQTIADGRAWRFDGAHEEAFMARFGLTDAEKALIRKRDFQGMIDAGMNIYSMLKIGSATGNGLYKMGAQMRGESYEQFLATRNIRGAV